MRKWRAFSYLLALACFFYATRTASEWQVILDAPRGELVAVTRGLPVGGVPVYSGAYQSILSAGPTYQVQYGFLNFNNDNLGVKFKIDKTALNSAVAEFGYEQRELDSMLAQYQQSVDAARAQAQFLGLSQAQADARLAFLEQNYKKARAQYLASKGFKLLSEHQVEIDMPMLVGHNTPRLRSLAQVFAGIADDNQYGSDDLIGAVTAMVQTAMFYGEPPMAEGDRNIAGLLPPLEALTRGWGDCDTKTGVLASILRNWSGVRAIGVALPKHYLMGICRLPRHGDVYMDYGGLQYVLVEPAGPAWLPVGSVGQDTMDMLQSQGVEIDPF